MNVPAKPSGSYAGPYQLLRELGSGGMGRVYLARSPGGREVAVKLLWPELARSAAYRQRFAVEVAAAKAVHGVFTAPVIDAAPFDPEPWLATAYVPGPTLERAIGADGPLAERALRELAAGLAEALGAIHAAGVTHRDLKPSNVLMSPDGPRVIDFGISNGLDSLDDAADAEAGVAEGSAGYGAPEQADGDRPADARADVFSLGAVLVFAATGRGPFGEGPPAALGYRVAYEEPDLTGVPEALQPTLAACLDKDPAGRPSTAEVLAALAPPDWAPPPAPAVDPTEPDATGLDSTGLDATGLDSTGLDADATGLDATGLATTGFGTAASSSGLSTRPEPPSVADTQADAARAYGSAADATAPGSPPTGYGFALPPTSLLPPPGPTVALVPDGGARDGLTRRKLLTMTGIAAAGVTATAGTAALVIDLTQSSPSSSTAKAASPTKTPTGTSTANLGNFAETSASLPKAPKPLWTVAPPMPPTSSTLVTQMLISALDDVVLWYPTITYTTELGTTQPLIAYDAATGRQVWSADGKIPTRGTQQTVRWTGVDGSLIYGLLSAYDPDDNMITSILAMNSSGQLVTHQDITAELLQLQYVSNGIALGTQVPADLTPGEELTAYSIADGSNLWHIDLDVAANPGFVADAQRCFVFRDGTVTAYDLRHGTKLWAQSANLGTSCVLWTTESAVLVSTEQEMDYAGGAAAGTIAFDPATGKHLWNTASAVPFAVLGDTVYASGASITGLTALDARTGRALWTFASPVRSTSVDAGVNPQCCALAAGENVALTVLNMAAQYGSTTADTAPGFVVLDGATGKARWAYTGDTITPSHIAADVTGAYTLTVSDTAVYATAGTTLTAYRAGS